MGAEMRIVAYTLGSPRPYEAALDEGPVRKQPGGVVYRTRASAQAVLDAHAGFLPPAWFDDGLARPGRVYGLRLASWDDVEPWPADEDDGESGERLRVEGEVFRLDQPAGRPQADAASSAAEDIRS